MNPKTYRIFSLLALLVFIVTSNCQKREWDSPFDSKSKLRPEEWAPQNFQVEDVSITEKKLTWTYDDKNIEGFKLDRKKGDEPWQPGFQTFTKETRSWNDTDIIPDPTLTYNYRLYTYAGMNESAKKDTSFQATIPSPENLSITANSATSVTLNWSYLLTGHEGFKVERKIDNESWSLLMDNLGPNQRSFTDESVYLDSYTYHYRVFSYLAGYNSDKPEQSITFIFTCGETITDARDVNQYETIQIGNQCWLKENLKWLPSVSPSANGSNTTSYYYVYGYQGTSVSEAKATNNYQTYGVLYNWSAALNACPADWHLPSDSEWTVLVDYLGGSSVAGGKMKATGTTHWSSPNTGATNSSGFSGLPGGYRLVIATFGGVGNVSNWWSSTEYNASNARGRGLIYANGLVTSYGYDMGDGFSVRCLKD
jgi:uncharacterized protein (TIGR02145 family)